MFTIRSFRNEDPPKILDIWQKNRRRPERTHFFPLSMGQLEAIVLAMPFFDYRFLQLAFEGDRPVGFAHATLGPNPNGSNLSSAAAGQICAVLISPDCSEPLVAAQQLIAACERSLIAQGVREIHAGSPRPSAPFYVGLYSGAEPIGIIDSDTAVIEAFQKSGYVPQQKTARFQLELTDYLPPTTSGTLEWMSRVKLDFGDRPEIENWWDACMLAHFDWLETTACLLKGMRPVSRVRIRMSDQGSEKETKLYDKNWDASLIDIRVHPEYRHQGLAAYTLGETLRLLVMQSRVARIEAHVGEADSMVHSLLRRLRWNEVETGTAFKKIVS